MTNFKNVVQMEDIRNNSCVYHTKCMLQYICYDSLENSNVLEVWSTHN